jgi:hypothetical protein
VPGSLKGKLAIYYDPEDMIQAVGPKGWSCSASVTNSGSMLAVYPKGAPAPRGQAYSADSAQGIVVSETGACVQCSIVRACPAFPVAATVAGALMYQCPAKPPNEVLIPILPSAIGFEDPPHVAGTGTPSGGQYTARGIVTYTTASHPSTGYKGSTLSLLEAWEHSASWLGTCTLPASDDALCTATLNAFTDWYGSY